MEFDWPQQHWHSTLISADCTLWDLPDGDKAAVCHDTDRIYGHPSPLSPMHPGVSVIEIPTQLYGGTPLPQLFPGGSIRP